jgi:tetratricopeptide (TPR) repeat protein
MNSLSQTTSVAGDTLPSSSEPTAITFPSVVAPPAHALLVRMFRDPYLLEAPEKTELIAQLRKAVELAPQMSELHVLLGMALCVNFEAQEALEELRDSVRLAPDSFIARLKLGELLMRLRITTRAAEETRAAAQLASTPLQSDLARRQAAAIRAMEQAGIQRGGYGKLLSLFSLPFTGVRRLLDRPRRTALIAD